MDLDEMVRRADPAKGAAVPPGTSAIAHWTYSQITRADAPRSRWHPRWGWHPRLRLVLSVVTILALVLVGADVLHRSTPPRPADAASVLRRAAIVVSDQSAPRLAPGQYLYVKTQSLIQATVYEPTDGSKAFRQVADAQYQETEQSWADKNGSGTGLLTRQPLQFTSSDAQSAWEATSAGRLYSSQFLSTVPEPSLQQSAPDVSRLSLNPKTLTRQILDGADGTNVDRIPLGRSALFERVSRILIGPDVGMTTSLSSALYRVLADEPGVSLLGPVTDHQGRTGVGVSVSSPTGASTIIINVATGAAIEIEYAPRLHSLPRPTGGPTVTCISGHDCATAPQQLEPLSTTVVAPIWTDAMTTGIVNEDGATSPISSPR
jgi:hypothetical protein